MDEKTRQFLISRGLNPNASEKEAYRFLAKLGIREEPDESQQRSAAGIPASGGDDQEAKTPVDVDKLRKEATASERKRINEVLALGQRFDCEEFVEDFLTADTPIEQVRMKVAEHVFERTEKTAPQNPHPATILVAGEDKFRAAVEDSLIMRSSLYDEGSVKLTGGERAAPGAEELMGYSLRELARECLRVAGQPTGGHVLEMVGRALVTSDLPSLLANVANKSLFAGWDKAPETWQEWCGTDIATDFKTHDLPRSSEFSSLDQIPEHGEYQYGKITDAKEQFQLGTYGKLFAISRQAIINDDVGVVTKIPAMHGEAAARKVGDVVYSVLTANGNMGDGNALFDATNHGNYIASGSGAAPGVATIAAGIKAMKLQKGLQSLQYLNIRPEFFIAPATLEGVSEVFFNSQMFSDHSTVATDSSFASTRTNPYAGKYFTRVYDARLDAASTVGWYLAGPKGKTVNVFFLQGVKKPYLEQRDGWRVDGTEMKVRIDVVAKAVDWKALFMNYGS